MELRIGINNRRKQFTGIGRDHLCDFQDGVQYQFPYPVRCGQFESTSCGFTEECSGGFVGLKPFHRAKYVVLHHGQREVGNQGPVVLGEALLLEFLDNLVGCQITPLGVVFGLSQFDHTNQMTLDVSAGNQANEVCTGKPTVNEQIVESDAALDGVLHQKSAQVNQLSMSR